MMHSECRMNEVFSLQSGFWGNHHCEENPVRVNGLSAANQTIALASRDQLVAHLGCGLLGRHRSHPQAIEGPAGAEIRLLDGRWQIANDVAVSGAQLLVLPEGFLLRPVSSQLYDIPGPGRRTGSLVLVYRRRRERLQ